MSLKKTLLFAALLLAAVVARPALAQSHSGDGCGDSPENPTVILAGLASGAYGLSALRTRLRARRRSRTE